MTDGRRTREETHRPGVLRGLIGLFGSLVMAFFGNLIAAVLVVAYLVLLLAVSVVAGIVFNADVGLIVFLTAFGLSVIVPVVLGLWKYRRDNPQMFNSDLRDAAVAWAAVLGFAGVFAALIVLVLNLVSA